MALVGMICPQCGAKLDVEEGREFFFCQYCGTKITFEKQYVEMSGTVNVSGIATESSLLEKATIQLRNGQFTAANETLERVLDINPRNAEAYVGKLMAELGINDVNDLEYHNYPLDVFINYQNALRYGNSSQKKDLEEANTIITKRLMERIPLPEYPGKGRKANKYIWIASCAAIALFIAILFGIEGGFSVAAIWFCILFAGLLYLTRKLFAERLKEYNEYLIKKETYDNAISNVDEYRKKIFRIKYYR